MPLANSQLKPRLIFVGGFLGAGKTSLILHAARLLQKNGKRVAIVTNDQDASLVDTRIAVAHNIQTEEVGGGCFCCRFSDLMKRAEGLRNYSPDVIFAEPVGSCVDLSATILQPLKRLYEHDFELAPLTVLVDPAIAKRAAHNQLDRDIAYLFQQQIAEADILCTTKSDIYAETVQLSMPVDFELSSVTGHGVSEWIDEVMAGTRVVGARLLEVDYDRYAEAEAALAWLNLHASVQFAEPKSPALLCGPLLDRLQEALRAKSIYVAHLKLFDQCATGWLKVALTGDMPPKPEGDLLAEAAEHHDLAINLRAIADPDAMRQLVVSCLGEVDGSIGIRHLRAFRPARPTPEHRFSTSA